MERIKENNRKRQKKYYLSHRVQELLRTKIYTKANKEKINKHRRERYATDPIYREKILLRERKRKSVYNKEYHRKYNQKNKEKVAIRTHNYYLAHKEESFIQSKKSTKKASKNLSDGYISTLIRNDMEFFFISPPKEIINLKRLIILVERLLKSHNPKLNTGVSYASTN